MQCPADPEVFFDILLGSAKPVAGADKQVAALLFACSQHGLKAFSHLFLERLSLFMIWPALAVDEEADATTRRTSVLFSFSGGPSALACRSRSRTITRIHSGSACKPSRRSFWMACP